MLSCQLRSLVVYSKSKSTWHWSNPPQNLPASARGHPVFLLWIMLCLHVDTKRPLYHFNFGFLFQIRWIWYQLSILAPFFADANPLENGGYLFIFECLANVAYIKVGSYIIVIFLFKQFCTISWSLLFRKWNNV